MAYGPQDALLNVSKALPAGAEAVNSAGIDLRKSANGAHLADVEFILTAPALATGDLGDTHTMKYKIQMDNDSAFGSPTDLMVDVIIQTGAGGAGAAGAVYRFKLPSNVERYIRFVATASNADDASGKSATLEPVF